MNVKKIIALGMSAAMMMGMSMNVLAAPSAAASGSATESGSGVNEGLVDKEVYSVTLPTINANTYKFYLDPDNNIVEATGTKRYTSTPTNTTMAYFDTTSSTMTAQSATATITNESYQDIDVTIQVKVTGNTKIAIEEVTSAATSSGMVATGPAMFMGLETTIKSEADRTGATGAAFVPSTGTLIKTFTVASDAGDYTRKWDGSTKYIMDHTGTAKDPGTIDFNLVVGCNSTSDVDWTAAATETPAVEITYSYAKAVTVVLAPTLSVTSAVAVADTGVVSIVTLNGATSVTGVTFANNSGDVPLVASTDYTFTDNGDGTGEFKLKKTAVNAFVTSSKTSRVFTITFNNGQTATLTLTK